MEKLFFSSLPLTYRWILATLMWSRRGKKSNVCRGCRSAYISQWLISMYFFIVEALVTSAGRSKDLKARKWFLWSGLKRCLWNTMEKLLLLFPWIKGGAESFNRKKKSNAKTLFMVQLLFSLVTMLVKKALGMLRTVTYGETVNDTS